MAKGLLQKDIKILVVDDNVQTAVNISGFLSLRGFKTLETYTFKGAIETAKKRKTKFNYLRYYFG
jgi:DNA-binding response OmpR family regulator